MKLVAINGSHRGDKGYTNYLISKLFKGATDCGADCEEIILSALTINRCKACQVCTTEKSFLKCVYDTKDDVSFVFDKMRQADILIYATPIYVMNMSGLMKVFLDRIYSTGDCTDHRLSNSGLLFHHISKDIYSKPFITLTCQDNIENETSKSVVSYFKTFSRFMDAPYVGKLTIRSGRLTGHGKSPEKEKLFPKIYEKYTALETAGKELIKNGGISRKTQRKVNQDIISVPFFSILKNFKWFKKKALVKMKEMQM